MSRLSHAVPPIIAVDFDGTITKFNDYNGFTFEAPLKEGAQGVLQRLKAKGATIILWTCREGVKLEEARIYCEMHDIPIDYYNENVPELIAAWGLSSRKVFADYYVDDLAFDKQSTDFDWYEVEYEIMRDPFFCCQNCWYYDRIGGVCAKVKNDLLFFSEPDTRKPTGRCRHFELRPKGATTHD